MSINARTLGGTPTRTIVQDYKKLKVWEKSHQLTLAIYRATEPFPRSEMYGLTSQMRRASSSVGCNIAEGCGRDTNAQLLAALFISLGSSNELEYQLLLVRDLGLITTATYDKLFADTLEVKRMLSALIVKLKQERR